MLANGQAVVQIMERFAPKQYAMEGDKIGLQLGSANKPITKVLVALDVTDEVVDEAIESGVNMIIAHHAIIYRPLAHLQTDSPVGRLYEKLIKHDIAVYISHTNLDTTEGGMNDLMADLLQLEERVTLEPVYEDKLFKLVVFVPNSHLENVRQAIFAAGAGHIGKYSHCSFNIEGTGTFLPGEQAEPYSGSRGKLAHVEETRLETVVPQSARNKVVQAMIKAHPYEEVAYDLYPLQIPGKVVGLGRVGRLLQPITLLELAEKVKEVFDVPFVRMVGIGARPMHKVAVLGGSGSRYVQGALYAGADVLITGDIDYHTAHDALCAGLALIDPGHNAEKVIKSHVAAYLNQQFRDLEYSTTAISSCVSTEPFQLV